jgi:hypothetical protein
MDSAANTVELIRMIIVVMRTLTDEERLDIINQFCKHCGSINRECYCMMCC